MDPNDNNNLGNEAPPGNTAPHDPNARRILPRADAYPYRVLDETPAQPGVISPQPATSAPAVRSKRSRFLALILLLTGGILFAGILLFLLLHNNLASNSSTSLISTRSGATPTAAMGTPGTQRTPSSSPQPTGIPGLQTTQTPDISATHTPGAGATNTPGARPTPVPTLEPTAPATAPAKLYVSPNPTSMSCLPGGKTALSVDNDGGQNLNWTAATDTSNVTVTPSGSVAPNTSQTASVEIQLVQLGTFHVIFHANGAVKTESVTVTCS